MCMSACIKAKIQNFIYGAPSESEMNPNITIFDIKENTNNKLNIEIGVLKDECQLQIENARQNTGCKAWGYNEEIIIYKKYLSDDELEFLKRDIKDRIDFVINSMKNISKDKQTRYYLVLDKNKVIAFQTAQVRKENNRIEGWRNFAYTDNNYKGKIGEVIDTYGDIKTGILSNLLYESTTKWFSEENVVAEKTATGKHMYKNIKIYIIKKGFVPEKMDDKKIYLIKDYKKNKSKVELKQIYENYINELKI